MIRRYCMWIFVYWGPTTLVSDSSESKSCFKNWKAYKYSCSSPRLFKYYNCRAHLVLFNASFDDERLLLLFWEVDISAGECFRHPAKSVRASHCQSTMPSAFGRWSALLNRPLTSPACLADCCYWRCQLPALMFPSALPLILLLHLWSFRAINSQLGVFNVRTDSDWQ